MNQGVHALVGRTDLGPSINPAVPGSNIESYEYEKKQRQMRNAVTGPKAYSDAGAFFKLPNEILIMIGEAVSATSGTTAPA